MYYIISSFGKRESAKFSRRKRSTNPTHATMGTSSSMAFEYPGSAACLFLILARIFSLLSFFLWEERSQVSLSPLPSLQSSFCVCVPTVVYPAQDSLHVRVSDTLEAFFVLHGKMKEETVGGCLVIELARSYQRASFGELQYHFTNSSLYRAIVVSLACSNPDSVILSDYTITLLPGIQCCLESGSAFQNSISRSAVV